MQESKSLKVGTSEEQWYIDTMQCFGWELKSSQEINTKDSHLENRSGTIYSVTTSENYVKLTFSRNIDKNKSQLDSLENEFFRLRMQRPTPLSIGVAAFCFILYIIPGILYVRYKKKQKKEWEEKSGRLPEILREAERLVFESTQESV